jgi:phospholipase C
MEPSPAHRRYALSLAAALTMLAGCHGSQAPVASQQVLPQTIPAAGSAIRNVVVIVQSERSFDNLFAGYPGADAPTQGLMKTPSGDEYVPLKPVPLRKSECGNVNTEEAFWTIYDGGKMDGWNLVDPRNALCPYTRVKRHDTRTYWELAKQFALADHMFASTHFGSFVNQIYLIAGTTKIKPNAYDIGAARPLAGCDSPAGTKTSILKDGHIEALRGPFPCFTQFPTMANLLDKAHVAWKYYYGVEHSQPWGTWNAFASIKYVRFGKDWSRNMSRPASNVLADIANARLSAVSWVISPYRDSDAPGYAGGPRWVDSIVSAMQKSTYWDHSAIVIVWADGGSYDNVAPPQLDPMGLGFRVPMIVVSPLAKRGYVSHVQYEFGSILKFIEETWNLGSLGATDERANDFRDIFE